MKVVIFGSTGRTGIEAVRELLNRGVEVRAVARHREKLEALGHSNLEIVTESAAEITVDRMKEILKGADAVVSCLGHNITFKGLLGRPWYLVTQSLDTVISALKGEEDMPSRLVLMNTVGVLDKDMGEKWTLREKLVMAIMDTILPPTRDNKYTVRHLKKRLPKGNTTAEWTAVRPDTLFDADEVTEYRIVPTHERSPIFNAGNTSRINAGHFMAALVTEDDLWEEWKFRMPIVYNA